MAMEWMDNFSLYGSGATGIANMLNGAYASAANEAGSSPLGGSANTIVADPDPNATGFVYRMGDQFNNLGVVSTTVFTNILRKVLSAPRSIVGVGQRVWFNSLPSSTTEQCCTIFQFKDVSNNLLLAVEVTPTGNITVWRGTISEGGSSNVNRSAVLGTTLAPVIVANAWQHVEVRVEFSATVGTVEVRVEGVQVLSLTGVNTSAAGLPCASVAQHNFQYRNTGVRAPVWHIKDFFAWNTLGTRNNSFRGALIIGTLVPNGDVALNWTPVGAANGWSLLDNAPPVDTTFITAGNTPIPSPYEASMTNLPPDVTSVLAVMAVTRARKIDGGDGNIQVTAVSGVSTAAGANRPITAAFTYWQDMFEEDPATSAPWTPAGVNGMNLRLNRTV